MSDSQTPPPKMGDPIPAASVQARPPRWKSWVFGLSITLNLLILGVVGGAALRHNRDDGPPLMVRDLSIGLFSEAFSDRDRSEIRRAFLSRLPDFRSERSAARAEFEQLLTALTAEPFDLAKVQAQLDQQKDRLSSRLAIGQSLVLERVAAMTAEERAAFAERLRQALERGRGGERGRGRGGD